MFKVHEMSDIVIMVRVDVFTPQFHKWNGKVRRCIVPRRPPSDVELPALLGDAHRMHLILYDQALQVSLRLEICADPRPSASSFPLFAHQLRMEGP